MNRLIIVAAAHQLNWIQDLHDVDPKLVVIWKSKKTPANLSCAKRLEDAVADGVQNALFLTPQASLAADVAFCQERGVRVHSAGPIPDTGRRSPASTPNEGILCGMPWRHDGLWKRLEKTRQRPAFGAPVFYRRVSGGGASGLLSTWWALWQGLMESAQTLSSPVSHAKLNVTRRGPRRLWHASMHVHVECGATAQIVVTPQPDADRADRLLVGTGGSISTDSTDTGLHLIDGDGGIQPLEARTPLQEWVRATINSSSALPDPQVSGWQQLTTSDSLLNAIRRAARHGQTVTLT